jgi:hypothetical protein
MGMTQAQVYVEHNASPRQLKDKLPSGTSNRQFPPNQPRIEQV